MSKTLKYNRVNKMKIFHKILEGLTAFFLLLVIFSVFLDVILRHFFNSSFIALQELEWHFFTIMFLFGISYSLLQEAHVRVDFLFDVLSAKKRATINIIGTILFLLPFCLLIIYGSYEYVLDAYETQEISENPGGLTHRWIIKAMIPISFITLIISAVFYVLKNIEVLRKE